MTSKIYAIGDIHGQLAMLEQALALVAADGGGRIVFVGDYTDRGPNSRAVLETLMRGVAEGRDWVLLRGNHDRFYTRYWRDGTLHDPQVRSGISWLNPRLGGDKTIKSYGLAGEPVFHKHADHNYQELKHWSRGWRDKLSPEALMAEVRSLVPQEHVTFLEGLPLTYETSDLFFVHAGIRPSLALDRQVEDDLLWIRDGFLTCKQDFPKLIVHGHTALDHPAHFGNRVDIDGGAGYGKPLVPCVFEGRDVWTLTREGRIPLVPDHAD